MNINEQRICIVCPAGCRLKISGTSENNLVIIGGKCKRGEEYGHNEIVDPRRVVTAVVPGQTLNDCCVPVKTDRPLPRALVNRLLEKIYSSQVKLPVKTGDVLISDFCDSGVNVVITRTIKE
jgi:CxxC motif-containing protein